MSDYITAHSEAEVRDLERRYKEQGYLPFHRRTMQVGTWRVYKGKMSDVNPNLIENISDEDITRRMFEKTYVPRPKPKTEEPKTEQVKEQPQQKSKPEYVITSSPYATGKEAEDIAAKARSMGVDATASIGNVVVFKGENEEELRKAAESLNRPATQEEKDADFRKKLEEEKRHGEIRQEVYKETPDQIRSRLKTHAEERKMEQQFAKEYEGQARVWKIPLKVTTDRYPQFTKEHPELSKELGIVKTSEVNVRIPHPTMKDVKSFAESTGSDIKGVLSTYSKSQNQSIRDKDISQSLRRGINRQTQVVKSGGRPEIMQRPRLRSLKDGFLQKKKEEEEE